MTLGTLRPQEVLYCARKAGVTHVLKAGGAQAVAAMAWGTESCPKVCDHHIAWLRSGVRVRFTVRVRVRVRFCVNAGTAESNQGVHAFVLV